LSYQSNGQRTIDEKAGKFVIRHSALGKRNDCRFSGLSEELKVRFNDREKAGISEREILIDPQGNIKSGDLEKLGESLANAKASPIRVIKNNL